MKSIVVHLDASPRAAVRLALAQRLACRHGAELSVLYGVQPAVMATPLAAEGLIASAPFLEKIDREQRARARATFDGASGQGGKPIWIDGGLDPYRQLLQRALYADLIVLGQVDDHDSLTGALPPDLVCASIIDSGKPTLVVPFAGQFEALAGRVLLAWKPTREAARAVAAALPWLHLAKTLHIATRREVDEDEVDHAAALTHWLKVQGVAAAVRTHGLGPGDIGEELLSLAADTGAELLVMGCYGHSRVREWVLGGASRSILRAMSLPVLMAH